MNLEHIFEARQSFMSEIEQLIPGTYPEEPNLTDSKTQSVIREITLRGVEEIFEALQHLKGWKTHRADIDCSVDEEGFLEEVVDAFNYFFSLMILAGVSPDDFEKAFKKKDQIIRARLQRLK